MIIAIMFIVAGLFTPGITGAVFICLGFIVLVTSLTISMKAYDQAPQSINGCPPHKWAYNKDALMFCEKCQQTPDILL